MDNNGLGKLLPRSIRRRRRDKDGADTDDSEGPAGREGGAAILPRNLATSETFESDYINPTNMADEDDTGFVSYESDPETSEGRPAPISTHPSQIGYLTTSSPIVQAEHLPEHQSQESSQLEQLTKSSTLSSKRSASIDSEPRARQGQAGLAPPQSSSKRSPSPVGRIRSVFRSKKSSSSSLRSDAGITEPLPVTTALDSVAFPKLAAPAEEPEAPEAPDAAKAVSQERQRVRAQSKLDTTDPPRTPPTTDPSKPQIVNTPPTPTDPGFPRDRSTAAKQASSDANANGSSPTGNMISQKRNRAGSGNIGPSKLSNITPAPLTPTSENVPLPPNATSGFFSSMISAAQNAANTLSTSIQNTSIGPSGGKTKSPGPREPDIIEEETPEVETTADLSDRPMESKELAVRTLGTGELSLSQLGIAEVNSTAATPVTSKFPDSMESRSRSESAPADASPVVGSGEFSSDDPPPLTRPRSLHETAPSASGDRTPPTTSLGEDKPGVQRSGSVRSAIGRRRKRGSSATTGGTGATIGAAIAAANASLAHPNATAGAPKLTGFAVASKKRNRDFHNIFKSVPDDDYLIEDYSCALQREILAHGRLYVSEGHLCFSSNILGWITTLVMSFDEIVSVEKRSTALVFKNGLMISTLHAKHIFASFTSRDSTYDLIVNIWKLGHPSLRSTLNGVRLEGTGGDKTEKIEESAEIEAGDDDQSVSGSEEESDDGGDVYDEDDENGYLPETTQNTELSMPETEIEKPVTRKPSGAVIANGVALEQPKDNVAPPSGTDFPGPATHAPTDCGDSATHYDKIVGDDVIPAPIGKVYNLLFGASSVTWMSKWLTTEQKCTDLQMEDKKGLSPDNKSRSYTYIKPLNASIGPKQTKCIVTETLDNYDLEKAVNLSVSTQNPDVPSGNVFSVKTKYCLSWAENNGTRVQVNCTVEWTGKSWLKGPIEKGANDGQTQHCKDLFVSLKAAVSSRPRSGTGSNGVAAKGKKKGRKGKAPISSADMSDGDGSPKHATKQDWGLLEPIRGIFEPIVDIIGPLLTGNVMYGLLVGLLVATWFGFGFSNRRPTHSYGDLGFYGYPDRLVAYEEMWRREESELWDWLEERVGLNRLGGASPSTRKKVMEPRTVEEKIREEKMDDREIEEVIRVTEEKLNVLKGVIDKRKEGIR